MVPDPNMEKLPPLLVPLPEKENENAVCALAGLDDRMIAAATGKIQDGYFRLGAEAENDAQRMEIAFTNDMTTPPSGLVVFSSPVQFTSTESRAGAAAPTVVYQ